MNGIFGFTHNGTYYYYGKNIFGDIVDVYDATGNKVAHYAYDAWGNHEVRNPDGTKNVENTFIGNINPFRYRGYYFDDETGFYCINSRYYDPRTGRFINADTPDRLGATGELHGYNLYTYCGNNPVMKKHTERGDVRGVTDVSVAEVELMLLSDAVGELSKSLLIADGIEIAAYLAKVHGHPNVKMLMDSTKYGSKWSKQLWRIGTAFDAYETWRESENIFKVIYVVVYDWGANKIATAAATWLAKLAISGGTGGPVGVVVFVGSSLLIEFVLQKYSDDIWEWLVELWEELTGGE